MYICKASWSFLKVMLESERKNQSLCLYVCLCVLQSFVLITQRIPVNGDSKIHGSYSYLLGRKRSRNFNKWVKMGKILPICEISV